MLDLHDHIRALLPMPALIKLEKMADARSAAHVAYTACVEAEQDARHELMRQQGFARRGLEMGAGIIINAPVSNSGLPTPEQLHATREAFRSAGDEQQKLNERMAAPVKAAEEALARRVEAKQLAVQKWEEHHVVDHICDWLARNAHPGSEFKMVKPIKLKSRDPVADLQKVRQRLITIDEQYAEIEETFIPRDVLKANALAEIDALAEHGCPRVSQRNRSHNPLGIRSSLEARGSGASLLAWLLADEFKARISTLVDSLPPGNEMSDHERASAFEGLAQARLDLEREEEALVEAAEAAGYRAVRRADADPRAVLGITD